MTELLQNVVPKNSIRFFGHEEHRHEVPHLIHVVRGTARLTVDAEPIRLSEGESLWLAPEVPHAMRLAPGSLALGPLLSPACAPPGVRVRRLGAIPALTDLMTTILGAAPATPEEVLPFRRALEVLLTGLQTEHFRARWPTDPTARRIAEAAVGGSETLARIAARHYVSVRQVQRMFLEQTGLPFARWRTRARLNRAVVALRGGGNLDEARRASGYATRTGLLRALSREAGRPERDLAADPLRSLGLSSPAAVA